MNQSDLFTDAPVHPRARRTDPVTSHEAAALGKKRFDLQRERVLGALKAFPGRTSFELARDMKADRYMVAKRLPELRKIGDVRNGEQRKCWISGLKAMTWWAL